jgi:tetratricopeptide (TPR) repeat protein
LAVVNWRLKKAHEANKFFQHSLQLAESNKKSISEIVHNYSAFLIDQKKYKEASLVLDLYLKNNFIPEDVSTIEQRILLKKIIVLEALQQNSEATELAEKFLEAINFKNEIKLDLYNHLICYYSTMQENNLRINAIINDIDELLIALPQLNKQIKARTLNNTAYACLISKNLLEAKKRVALISGEIHHDPYVTATFGLFKLRSGDVARGKQLYLEAIGLLKTVKDKGRFKQRMHYELGRTYVLEGDMHRATRCFLKAKSVRLGQSYLNTAIDQQLKTLPPS